jgi:hypothetical protein
MQTLDARARRSRRGGACLRPLFSRHSPQATHGSHRSANIVSNTYLVFDNISYLCYATKCSSTANSNCSAPHFSQHPPLSAFTRDRSIPSQQLLYFQPVPHSLCTLFLEVLYYQTVPQNIPGVYTPTPFPPKPHGIIEFWDFASRQITPFLLASLVFVLCTASSANLFGGMNDFWRSRNDLH